MLTEAEAEADTLADALILAERLALVDGLAEWLCDALGDGLLGWQSTQNTLCFQSFSSSPFQNSL